MRVKLGRWLLAATILLSAVGTADAQGGPRLVDVQLILAVDRSASISDRVLDFQLAGHAAAFRDDAVIDAMLSHPGGVAVTLVGWSSPGAVMPLVPWRVIASRDDAVRFAAAIDAAPRNIVTGTTAVGNLIEKTMRIFRTGGVIGQRRILDVSSNGFSNAGVSPAEMRDQAVAAGLTINALVILDDYDWLEDYYRDNVIGGPGAFVRVAQGEEDYATAIRDKLIAEIALEPIRHWRNRL